MKGCLHNVVPYIGRKTAPPPLWGGAFGPLLLGGGRVQKRGDVPPVLKVKYSNTLPDPGRGGTHFFVSQTCSELNTNVLECEIAMKAM